MKKIRDNTFETNSSSTHVIAVSKEKVEIPTQPTIVKLNEVEWGYEFGWSVEDISDIENKVAYLLLGYIGYDHEEDEVYSAYKQFKHVMKEINVIVKITTDEQDENNEIDVKERLKKFRDNSYIDHVDEIPRDLYTMDRLARLIYGEKSYIMTGNDNEDGYTYRGLNSDADWNEREQFREDHENEYEFILKGN